MKILVACIFSASCLFCNQFDRDDNRSLVVDSSRHLVWEDSKYNASEQTSYKNAIAYCHILANSEHINWRVPTIEELSSIVDNSRTPSISATFKHSASGSYWAKNKRSDSNDLQWLDFSDGTSYEGSGYEKRFFIRCVHNK